MTHSSDLFERALRVIPGGVNSPVRAFGSVGGTPVYIESAAGATLQTADGRRLLDFCGSWGPLVLGHAHPEVIEAVTAAARRGLGYGTNTPGEVDLAEQIVRMVPSIEKIRLTCSGTEATMTALRIARAVTGRHRILKFDGGYHGHVDALLTCAGSGLATTGLGSSQGLADPTATLVVPFNDLPGVDAALTAHADTVAAVIVEPVPANMGLVPPAPGFLPGLRELCTKHGALLIFDEVITGFRFGPTTYGQLCGVTPDLTCLGKIIGGGLPVGAVAGPARLMDWLSPVGPVYQAGTLSGNPVAVAAGLATLRVLERDNPYAELDRLGGLIEQAFNAAAQAAGVAAHCVRRGGVFTLFFRAPGITDYAAAKLADSRRYATFFHALLDAGFYLPPSQFEVGFVSQAHTEEAVRGFTEQFAPVLKRLA